MLQNINLKPKQLYTNTTLNSDATAAKNIINILFTFVDEKTKNDKKMSRFVKGMILNTLPGIRTGSINYVDDTNSSDIKKLLDDIENQLKNRK